MKASPNITKNGARRKLTAMKQRGEAMLAATSVNDTVLDTWSANCAKCVEEAFGDGIDHIHQFVWSAETVGGFRLWEPAEVVIEG